MVRTFFVVLLESGVDDASELEELQGSRLVPAVPAQIGGELTRFQVSLETALLPR